MPEPNYIDFSRWLTWTSVALNTSIILCVLSALLSRDRRLIRCARHAIFCNAAVMIGAAAGLVAGFLKGAYDVKYIYNYSERDLPTRFKITGLWAGLDGSILFWALLLSILTAIVAFGFREEEKHPVGRRLEPHIYLTLGFLQLFFLTVIAVIADPFTRFIEEHNSAEFLSRFPGGVVADGNGLNPILQSYWMQIHPPCMYTGWVLYSIPFAYGLAALIVGEQGNYWIRKVRRWMLVAWLFNTSGCIMGGLWAYEVLGWGGYWAWDPVENASIIPWFFSTAFLHSILVQERRGMLRTWNCSLICLTFLASIFGTFLTRSGIVSSVHAFASGDVGHWFLGLLIAVFLVSLFLVAFRADGRRSNNRIESAFSREAIFLLNNLVLVAIGTAIAVLTAWPKISNDWFGNPVSIAAPAYTASITPLFVILIIATAIGPGMGWIQTSKRALVRFFALPGVVALFLAFGLQWLANRLHGGEGGAIPWWQQIYPSALIFYGATLIITTIVFDFLRGARLRGVRQGKSLLAAAVDLATKDNRRYGGYIAHIGIAFLAIGVVGSSIYQVEVDGARLRQGESIALGDYTLTVKGSHQDLEHPVYQLNTVALALAQEGEEIGTLQPEIRNFRKQKQGVREPKVHRTLLQDIYVFYSATEDETLFAFNFYRKPYMFGIWIGWFTILAGGIWAALPMGKRRVGLSD